MFRPKVRGKVFAYKNLMGGGGESKNLILGRTPYIFRTVTDNKKNHTFDHTFGHDLQNDFEE